MPIYEYRCEKCSEVSEKICNTNQAKIECPKCGGKADRIVSLFSGQTDSNSNSTGCLPSSGFT